MHDGKTTVERAFELARGGSCRSMEELRRKLTAEGYESVGGHLSGRAIAAQLRAAMAAGKA